MSGEEGAVPLEMLVPVEIEDDTSPNKQRNYENEELTGNNFNTFGEQAPNLFSQSNEHNKKVKNDKKVISSSTVQHTEENKPQDRNVNQPSKGKSIKISRKVHPSSKDAKGAENMSVSNDSKEREKFASI